MHKLIIDQESAEIVRKIFNWKVNEGLGNLSICHRLNDMGVLNPTGYKKKKLKQNYNNVNMKQEDYSWCPSTVRNILKNDIYIGNVTQGKRRVKSYKVHKVEQVPQEEWITVENVHEAIIDKEVFQKAQELRKVDTRVQNTGELSIWAGVLKCADCGRAMHKKYCKKKSGTEYEYYICGTYRKKSNKLCTSHTLRVEELEEAVLEVINLQIERFVDRKSLVEQIKTYRPKEIVNENKKRKKQEKEIELIKINKLKKGLYEDWKNEYITKEEYLDYKKRYLQEIERIKKSILSLESQKEQQQEVITENNLWLESFQANRKITKLDRTIITELIDDIEVHENKKITIHFKFANEGNEVLE